MRPTIIRGDAGNLPLPDQSVDLIVTSPPYYNQRSYLDSGEHYAKQIGAEPTPGQYIDNLVDYTIEWMRVLKPTGSLWVNLGDKYAGSKSLLGLPWRYAILCIDDLGLILRAEVIWSKPNGLPESVTDRVRRSHEQWFHFVKSPHYFAAVDEIREATHRVGLTWAERKATGARTHAPDNGHMSGGPGMAAHPLGKLPGSVWSVVSEPLRVPEELGIDHFAAFPSEWPRRIILGWSPPGVCTECGEGRRPITTVDRTGVDYAVADLRAAERRRASAGALTGGTKLSTLGHTVSRTITGYACDCIEPTAPTRPAVVLDPFGGTGTTALVASVLGRHGISVDMSADYCRLAQWRTADPKQIAKVQRKST